MSNALLNHSTPVAAPQSGGTYKLVVRSADEAVKTIREQLGENARVLSVRQLPNQGLAGLFSRPRLEVIAQLPEPVVLPATLPEIGQPNNVIDRAYASAPAADFGARAMSSSADALSSFSNDTAPLERRDNQAGLPDLLRRAGFSPSIIGRLEGTSSLSGYSAKPLHRALVDVGSALGAAAGRRPRRALSARTAFIGTPGAGRTTALCKWLSREVFTHNRMGRVLKAEFDRPNPAEGLGVFCEALGLVMEHAISGTPVDVEANGFVYVDTPSISIRRPSENRGLARFLDESAVDGRVLVLNAVYDLPTLRDAYAVGRDLGATHLVFTHLDELDHCGKLWDFLVDGELTPLFLSTGPGLTGDLELDVVGNVLRRTLPGAPVPHLS